MPTRASRRRAALKAGSEAMQDPAFAMRLVRALAIVAVGGPVVLAAYADVWLVAGLVAWASAGLAWAWPTIGGLAKGTRASTTIVVGGLLVAAAGVAITDEPFLRLVPIALASALVLMFLLQLMRRDGRPDLTREVLTTSSGLAIVGMGAGYLALAQLPDGPAVVAIGMAALAVSVLGELLSGLQLVRAWVVPAVMIVGGLVAVGAQSVLGGLTWGGALLMGMLVAALSYSVRRVVEVQPSAQSIAAQVSAACASVLAVGVLLHISALLLR